MPWASFFLFCNLPYSDRYEYCNKFELKLNIHLSDLKGLNVYNENPDYRIAYANLLNFGEKFSQTLSDKQERVLLLNLLFQIWKG